MNNKWRKDKNRITAGAIVPNDGTLYHINGNLQAITSVEPGPVWLNDEHTHLLAPEGWLLVTTDSGFRIPVTPDITFIRSRGNARG
jgi:hypothetical protein